MSGMWLAAVISTTRPQNGVNYRCPIVPCAVDEGAVGQKLIIFITDSSQKEEKMKNASAGGVKTIIEVNAC